MKAVVRSDRPRRGASPRRSARRARCGGPISSARTRVRLLPETASRWVRSVARKASARSGGTREVSPTTKPGSSARASGRSPSVASRMCIRDSGGPVRTGGASPSTRRTAATWSLADSGGAVRATTRMRVDGSSPRHGADSPPRASSAGRSPVSGAPLPCPLSSPVPLRCPWTTTSVGVRPTVTAPSGAVTWTASAVNTSAGGVRWDPRTVGRVGCGSPVTTSSAVTRAYRCAQPGSGPRRRSAACSAAEAAPAAAHSSTAASATSAPADRPPGEGPTPLRRTAAIRNAITARPTAPAQSAATTPPGAPRPTAAAPQAASAGATRRRSAGPSCCGSESPYGEPAEACTGVRVAVMAAPADEDRRTADRRSRSPDGAAPRT